MSNDAHEATALPDEPALTPEALEELDDLLDELRTRGEEIPQWEFCDNRKSTRLNSSHLVISYAVFCLKKKKKTSIVVCNDRDIPRQLRCLNTVQVESH